MKNKCFVGYLKENKDDKNVVEYILIKEVILENFREEINRVYNYQSLENMLLTFNYNLKDFSKSLEMLQTSGDNITNDIYLYKLENEQVNIQRTFFNLINSYSLSIDHIKKILSSFMDKENNDYKFISSFTSFYYDNSAGYRIISSLRNYCQHKSAAPIEIHKNDKGTFSIFINKEILELDSIKNKIRLELDNKKIPFNLLFLVKEWSKNIIELYNYLFFLFAKYAKEQSLYLISFLKDTYKQLDKTNLPQLYIIFTDDKDNIYQCFPLPVKSAINIIQKTNEPDFNDKIEFISNHVDESEKSKQEAEELNKKLKEYNIELPKLDTLSLSVINNFLRDGK